MPRATTKDLTIGDKLIARYVELGVTRQQVADSACLDQSTLWRIEKGKVTPSLDTIRRLSVTLQVPVSYFV